jgi:hypothetical protein
VLVDAGDDSLDGAGFWSVSVAFGLVGPPPVVCTTPVGGSGVADGSTDDELPVAVDDVDETVVNDGDFDSVGDVTDGDFESVGDVDADDEMEGGLDELLFSADEEADEVDESAVDELDDEPESDGSAIAIPGMVATAEPTPSAIANAPTLPTYLT